jgi:hypothetical protein
VVARTAGRELRCGRGAEGAEQDDHCESSREGGHEPMPVGRGDGGHGGNDAPSAAR